MASWRLKSLESVPLSKGVPHFTFWNQRIHASEPTGGGLAWNSGFRGESSGYSAVMWQLMHELIGLSTGPLRRPFQPRWVGGSSFTSALIADSFRLRLIFVTMGLGLS